MIFGKCVTDSIFSVNLEIVFVLRSLRFQVSYICLKFHYNRGKIRSPENALIVPTSLEFSSGVPEQIITESFDGELAWMIPYIASDLSPCRKRYRTIKTNKQTKSNTKQPSAANISVLLHRADPRRSLALSWPFPISVLCTKLYV